jgi:tetratricopeptide (TPR) repeat protein
VSAGRPYASVLIPTHDRHTTLPLAVRSIQAQTVSDLEIIILADGATEAVKRVAADLAAADSRITLLDWPKAPGRGAASRGKAVLAAAAERIFYADDDDLFLPDHVETLGTLLEEADVAESFPASVSLGGWLQVAAVQHRAGSPMRDALSAGALKLTFDTHLAHRRSTFERLGDLWGDERGGDPVINFLSRMAQDASVRWRTLAAVTSLSFHGAARRYWDPAARAAELVRWSDKIVGGIELELAAAFADRHFWRCLLHFPAQPGERAEAYLDRLCVSRSGDPPRPFALAAPRLAHLQSAIALRANAATVDTETVHSVVRLADPLISVTPSGPGLANHLRRSLGAAEAADLLESVPVDEPFAIELLDHVRLCLSPTVGVAAQRFERAAARADLQYAPALRFHYAHTLRRLSALDAAMIEAEAALAADPKLPGPYRLLGEVHLDAGRADAAREIAERARMNLGDRAKLAG